jgi:tetratricopeptide (TPR) repeat protein
MAKSRKQKKSHTAAASAPRPGARDRLDVATAFSWRNRTDRIDMAIVLGVALVLRLTFFFLNRKLNPTFSFPIMDALYHHEWAQDLVAGGTKGTDAFFRGPLYPYFLSVLYRVSGSSIAFAVFVQHIIGALTAGLVYLTARELFSRSVALVAGLTTALYWVLVYMEGDLLIETSFIFLNTLAMLLLLQGTKRHSLVRLALGGFALGLATIDRPSILVFFPAIPIALYLAGRRRPAGARGWLRQTLVVAVACAIPIAPVMVRNYVVARAIVPIGTSGGVNFYIGNNPASDGSTAIVPGTRADWWGGYNDAIAIAERDTGRKLTLAEVSDYYFKRGFDYIRSRPEQAWRLMGKKFMMFWGAGERANDKYIYFFWHLAGMKYVPLPGFWLVAPLAILGGVLLWRRRAELAMFYLFVIVYSLGVIVFFVNARFRLPIIPVLTLFSGYATVYLVRGFRERQFGVVRAVLVLAAAALLVNSDYAYQKQMRAYSAAFSNYTLGNAYLKMGLESTALNHFSLAAEINRESPTPAYRAIQREVDYNLGVLLWKSGLCSRAIESLERVGGNDELTRHALDCLGDCYLKRQDLANARRVYEHLLQLSPSDQRAITGLARCAAMMGDTDKALSMLNEIVDPNRAVYPPAYIALAEIQRATGNIDAAIDSYTHIARLLGYERQGYIALAELYSRKGDRAAALQALDQASYHSPPNDPMIQQLSAAIRAGR